MNDNYLELLDKILLSNEVVDNFYNVYNSDIQFHNWLDEFIPEIDKCEKQQQNTPWHKYNVLRHILHSVEEMNKQTTSIPSSDRRMLAYIMLLHDIGKPDKHIIREKDGKMVDSFFEHNIRSCEIAKELLPKLNFKENEINIMLKLIYKHDMFMFIKLRNTNNPYWRTLDNKLIQEEINELDKIGNGLTLLKYLVMIGKSDSLAQNEKMTGESLKMLHKFENMLKNF